MVNSEDRGPFALWQLALYIAVLGLISMLMAPLSPLWWIVPVLGAAVPIVLAVIQGRQATMPDKATPVGEPASLEGSDSSAVHDGVIEDLPRDGEPVQTRPKRASATTLLPPGIALSERELAVLDALASGKTNAEVAADLYISVGTVKSHSANIYRKLEARNRTEAVTRARELGLLE